MIDAEPSTSHDADALVRALLDGARLEQAEARAVFAALVAGRLPDPLLAALLGALKVRGETPEEFAGAAEALRDAAAPFPAPDGVFADTCGTGGDGAATVNISTAAAFVCAAAGLPVAKHGNRSVSSLCGSADVLERSGVKIDCTAEISRRALDEAGVCFLYAPQYHPGLRHAAPVRRALKVRTLMNMLGPCVNPARPPVQIVGVAVPERLGTLAATLRMLGVQRALVVHGDGLDEVALHGPTQAVRATASGVEKLTLTPESAGVSSAPVDALAGGDPEENARRLQAVLAGRGARAETDAVAMNAGAVLWTAERAASLREGTALALDLLASGEPGRRLEQLAEISRA